MQDLNIALAELGALILLLGLFSRSSTAPGCPRPCWRFSWACCSVPTGSVCWIPRTANGAGLALTLWGLSLVANDGLMALLAFATTLATFVWVIQGVA